MSYNSLQASLLGNWMQQDNAASTVIVDSSGHSLNGTLINAGNTSAITTSGPNAYLPAGFTYDATNDYCDLTSDASLLPSSGVARTYEAWVKCRATGYNYLFAFGSPRPAITLTFVGNRPIIYLGASNYQYFDTSASTTLLDGNWHHIIAVITGTAQFDIDNCKLYLDGSSVTPSGGPSHAAAPETFSYLRSPVGNSYNVAATSGIAVHPTALSSTQVSERFAGPELENTSLPTLTIDSTSFSGSVGSWSLPSPFASGSNGTPTYQWELRDADDDSVVASGSTSTISGSGTFSGDYYLWVRASNDGGYDPAEDSVSATQTVSGGGPTYTLSAAYGSFTLTGNTASLKASRKITTSAGSYTLTGNTSSLKASRKLTGASGSFTLTGQAALLVTARKLVAAQGSYSLSGQASSLRAARKLVVAHGTFALSGQNVTLVYTPIGGPTYTLTIGTGTFALTGQATAIKANRRLAAVQGSFVVTGQGVTFRAARKLVAAQGEFAMTGQAAALKASRKLVVAQGSYTLTGQNVSLNYSGASGSRAFLYYYLMGT